VERVLVCQVGNFFLQKLHFAEIEKKDKDGALENILAVACHAAHGLA